jgi:hypothetical protein
MEPGKRKRGRPPGGKDPEKLGPSLKLTLETDRLLTAHANKLKLSKRRYGNAAIAYFAANGFDPTEERPQSLADVGFKVSQATLAIREQNVMIGNRLISIIRGWEKNLYTFMQQQQQATHGYLEQIESNILQHQVMVETNMLEPMVESLFKVNIEAFIARALTTKLFVITTNMGPGSYEKQMELSTNERDQQLATLLREFLETNTVPVPKPTPRRAVTPIPAKPVAPASSAPAVPLKS